jgi:CrcB protein
MEALCERRGAVVMNGLSAALCVAGGGAAGSLLRWTLGLLVSRWWPATTFPWATLSVNVTGSFLFGVVAAVAYPQQGAVREPLALLVLTGFLGGFTTFSSFSYETLKLVHDGRLSLAFVNVSAQVLLALAGCWAGWWATRFVMNLTG